MVVPRRISPGVRLGLADSLRIPARLIARVCGGRAGVPNPQIVVERRIITVRGRERAFLVYVPPGYTTSRRWPVILFLHGAGERGDDGLAAACLGIGPALSAFPERYPAIVILPQCPPRRQWSDEATYAIAALDLVLDTMAADEQRVSITGISMGGHGALHIAAGAIGRFRAVAAVCGWGAAYTAERLRNTSVWLFHGTADRIVPVEHSRALMAAFERVGAPHVRYTEYSGVGHVSWDLAYAEPDLPRWFIR
jgi:predicted peptidase